MEDKNIKEIQQILDQQSNLLRIKGKDGNTYSVDRIVIENGKITIISRHLLMALGEGY